MPPATRLAVVLSHPTQYYSPWFRWIARTTALDLRVFYLWDFGVTPQRDRQFETTVKWDVDLLEGYAHEFVPNTAREPGTHRFQGLRNPTLTARLAAFAPDALLLFGYKWNSHLRAIAWARRRGVPLLFRGDSHFLGRGRAGWAATRALRLLYAQFRAFLAVGAANRDYFTQLGVPLHRLFHAPHAVNHELFDPATPAHRSRAAALRSQLDLPAGTRLVLFAGKLSPAKQPRELLEAFLALQPERAALLFVGDGPGKPALQQLAASAPPGSVHFLPFANQSEMPGLLLAADLFVLPSRGHYETWGLVINEAMHLGVPCLVSDLVGCQRDLVLPGHTGWVFPHTDPAGLTRSLREALAAPDAELRRRGAAAREHIAHYTFGPATAGLLAALASLRPAATPPRSA